MKNQELQLVVGAGQVGPLVAERLRALGHRVRIGRRSAQPPRDAGLETVTFDASDADQVARAADGASVVYHCANAPYDQWPEKLLPLTRGIADGAERAGARLVVLDNLYMYRDLGHLTEQTPIAPRSKKGALRVACADYLLEVDARGKSQVAIGRAADFFGPAAPSSLLGLPFFDRVMAGKSAQVFGDPDQLHTYSFIPDVAAGLVALGEAKARGLWLLPAAPAETTRALIGRIGKGLGREIAIAPVPAWMLRGLGLFKPVLGEFVEMIYQWQQPYVVDDAKFRAAFGFGATPLEKAVAETVRWARAAYDSRGARVAA